MLTRMEISNMSNVGLELAYARTQDRLEQDWRRGAPGSLQDVYDLALMRLEADLRCLSLAPLGNARQLRLLDA